MPLAQERDGMSDGHEAKLNINNHMKDFLDTKLNESHSRILIQIMNLFMSRAASRR